jgi:DNA-binding transcriptional ArsR family regulator
MRKESKNPKGRCKIPPAYNMSPDFLNMLKRRMNENVEDTVRLFRVLSDPVRVRILRALDIGEMCVCVLVETLNHPYSALSYHLKMLKTVGLIKSKRDGNFLNYSITEKGKKLLKSVKTV